jgi:hypothetical protein
MAAKINNKNSAKPAPTAVGPALNYQPGGSPWGLEAFYEGYRLVFSADFNTALKTTKKWQKAFKFFAAAPDKNPGSIISNVDLYNLFSKDAMHAWSDAYVLAQKSKSQLGVEDIFLALLKESSVKNLLSRIKVDGLQAKTLINNYLKLTPPLCGTTVKKIPFEAFALAAKLHNHKVGTLMLLGGLLKAVPQNNILQAIFSNIGLSAAKLELFAVWLLDLDYEFPPDSASGKLLFCLRQARGLEKHFGYFFELPAIEAAVDLSQGQTLKDLQHLKALQLLVKAGLLAQNKKTKIISESLVKQVAQT